MAIRRALTFTVIGVLLGVAMGLVVWGGIPGDAAPAQPATLALGLTPVVAPLVGGRAPDFEALDTGGNRLRLSELQGRVVVLNFWATWCEPCRAEMPLLQARARGLENQGLSVIGVNFDEAATVVRAFQNELELSFPLLLDPGGHINALYRVLAYPTTFFVDAAGVIRFQHLGVMDEGQLDSYLDRMGLG